MAGKFDKIEPSDDGKFYKVTYAEESREEVNSLALFVHRILNERLKSALSSQDAEKLDRNELERFVIGQMSFLADEVSSALLNLGIVQEKFIPFAG